MVCLNDFQCYHTCYPQTSLFAETRHSGWSRAATITADTSSSRISTRILGSATGLKNCLMMNKANQETYSSITVSALGQISELSDHSHLFG